MRSFFSTLIAATLAATLTSPASAHDPRPPSRVYEDQAAGAIIGGIVAGVVVGAILNNGHGEVRHYHREPSRVRQYQPRPRGYAPQRPRGMWVDKGQYEHSTGRGCPGPIDYRFGTYWCLIR